MIASSYRPELNASLFARSHLSFSSTDTPAAAARVVQRRGDRVPLRLCTPAFKHLNPFPSLAYTLVSSVFI